MSSLKSQFVKDRPKPAAARGRENLLRDSIAGCSAVALSVAGDDRGKLVELLTTRDDPVWSMVHVYQVLAEPGSRRGWVYHEHQHDRLAFTMGRFKVVLHDLREDSPTFGKANVLIVGEERPALLTIAPFVAHCVENLGRTVAAFVNLPTRAYYHADPDKYRLPISSGLIPYPEGK